MSEPVPLTLGALRVAARSIPQESGEPLTVRVSPDLVSKAQALPNFVPREAYRSFKPASDNEIGAVEIFRFEAAESLPRDRWHIVESGAAYRE